uniref:Uncharacterized protein n=1 Tax=Octactis speculum TaxID=3111310 RepID=A0A7S2G4F5_9STRA|mmetsp:Transcript_37753/g.51126  ORF Transcript_37753/g.51126 Transcript_37753/m.51126 type:complete len:106 (+) Transcript_37753:249-566(+)
MRFCVKRAGGLLVALQWVIWLVEYGLNQNSRMGDLHLVIRLALSGAEVGCDPSRSSTSKHDAVSQKFELLPGIKGQCGTAGHVTVFNRDTMVSAYGGRTRPGPAF